MKTTADSMSSSVSQEYRAVAVESWRTAKWWFVLYAAIALAAIFYLPRMIPTAQSASDSYLFGYNNRIGILLLFFFVTIGTIWTNGFYLSADASADNRRLPRWMLFWGLALVALGCTVMYLFAGRYGGFGESYYLIDRIWILHMGRVPYQEFEFAYGPAQLYGPLLLHKLMQVGIPQAYYLFWALSYLLGTYFLFKSVDEVEFPTAAKPWIFSLLLATGLFAIIRMGANYTFLRYVLPVFFVIRLQRRFRDSHARSIILDVFLCAAHCGILTLLSPETAVAFAFASLCVCVFCRGASLSDRGLIAGLLVISYAATFLIAFKLHVLDTLLADGGGAISFPIVPTPTILIYFVALFVCACYLYRSFIEHSTDDSSLGLVFFSIPMVAAALGRCDPSHVFWNGLAAFFASSLYVSTYKRVWIAYGAAVVLFVFVAPNLSELYLFMPQLRSARFFNKHPEDRPRQERIERFLGSWPREYIAPFGYRPDGFGTYYSPRIEYGRFEDLINVSTPRSVHEKVMEIRNNPNRALILPDHADRYCYTNERTESHFLEVLLLSPYIGKFAHAEFVREPICRYVNEHYHMTVEPSAETFWYGIWVPNTAGR
jgi:hypothetical protein